jgi:aryl-alcohol dehydrogenase-like predicted oxidoreductase
MAIPVKDLGKTGAKVSAVGLGGHHLGDFATFEDAERVVHDAIDQGIHFFDNCW